MTGNVCGRNSITPLPSRTARLRLEPIRDRYRKALQSSRLSASGGLRDRQCPPESPRGLPKASAGTGCRERGFRPWEAWGSANPGNARFVVEDDAKQFPAADCVQTALDLRVRGASVARNDEHVVGEFGEDPGIGDVRHRGTIEDDEALAVALAQGFYQAPHLHGNEILRRNLAQSTGRNRAKARDPYRVDDLGYIDLRILKVIRQSGQRRVRKELVNARISEIAVDEQGRLRGIEGKRGRQVLCDETAAVPLAHRGNKNDGVLLLALLIDLGSQLAEDLDRGLFGMLGVDDASLPELVSAQQLAFVLGHARDGFGNLDLLPHEGRPRRGPSSCSRGRHELQISPFLSSFFQSLLDLAHVKALPASALRRASPKG